MEKTCSLRVCFKFCNNAFKHKGLSIHVILFVDLSVKSWLSKLLIFFLKKAVL